MSVPLINRARVKIASPHEDCDSIVNDKNKKQIDGVQDQRMQQTSTNKQAP